MTCSSLLAIAKKKLAATWLALVVVCVARPLVGNPFLSRLFLEGIWVAVACYWAGYLAKRKPGVANRSALR